MVYIVDMRNTCSVCKMNMLLRYFRKKGDNSHQRICIECHEKVREYHLTPPEKRTNLQKLWTSLSAVSHPLKSAE